MVSPADDGNTSVISDVLGMLDGEVAVGAFGPLSSSTSLPQFALVAHASNPDQAIGMIASAEGLRTSAPRKDAHGANVYAVRGQFGVATLQGWIVLASSQTVLNGILDSTLR